MPIIKDIFAHEIIDGRGVPTIEVIITLDNGIVVNSSVASSVNFINNKQTYELRDEEEPFRMHGKGVLKAVKNINEIIRPQLISKDPTSQEEIDKIMVKLDPSENRQNIGSNAILCVSQAVLKAGAKSLGIELYDYIAKKYGFIVDKFPIPIYAMVNGGIYGSTTIEFQEFQIIPASFIDYKKSIEMASSIWQKIEDILKNKEAIYNTSIIGGYVTNLYSNTDALELIANAIRLTKYNLSYDVFMGLDVGADNLYESGKYIIKELDKTAGTYKDLITLYKRLKDEYKIIYIEDPFEDNIEPWQQLTAEIGSSCYISADKLINQDPTLINELAQNKIANSITVKLNHLGTITEVINLIKVAKQLGIKIVVSHTSAETNDDIIADLAVGTGADMVKFGPLNRGERIAKYNRLLRIFENINSSNQQVQNFSPFNISQTQQANYQAQGQTQTQLQPQTPAPVYNTEQKKPKFPFSFPFKKQTNFNVNNLTQTTQINQTQNKPINIASQPAQLAQNSSNIQTQNQNSANLSSTQNANLSQIQNQQANAQQAFQPMQPLSQTPSLQPNLDLNPQNPYTLPEEDQ